MAYKASETPNLTQSKTTERGYEMTYELKKLYDFEFSRFWMQGGRRYIVLRDPQTGSETMEGYEGEGWVLRVLALPFQEQWDDEDAGRWGTFRCLVTGFMCDPFTREETGFPQMRQDANYINAKIYADADSAAPMAFTAVQQCLREKRNGEQTPVWRLKDPKTGFDFYKIPVAEFGDNIPKNEEDRVTVYIAKNAHGNICFKTAARYNREQEALKLPELFPQGKEATCRVVANDNSRFVLLKHPRVGTALRIPKPLNGAVPGVGESVQVKCTGFDTVGWPLLEWVGKYAKCDIPVDALPDLVLPRTGETTNVEYKSSLVFPPDAETGKENEADVTKQLGHVIMRVVASFMNSTGGTVFVGVRDDGTVCGIESEGPLLTVHNDDGNSYPPTQDGMRQIIINTVKSRLGESAGAFVEVEFKQGVNTKHVVCVIQVRASETELPVFMDNRRLFARYCGQTQELWGVEAARFIIDRLRNLDKARGMGGVVNAPPDKLADLITTRLQDRSKVGPLELRDNETVPLDAEHVAVVEPRGLVFDGSFQGEAKSWSDLYLRLLETLANVDGEKFEGLPDEDPKTFILRGSRVLFLRKGKGRGNGKHLKKEKEGDPLGPKKDVRAELKEGTRGAFTPPNGLVFRLIDYFGLKPEQFRIWTGPGSIS